jgi:hypothetical protein
MVGLQTLDLAIGVRVPASQPNFLKLISGSQQQQSVTSSQQSVPTAVG